MKIITVFGRRMVAECRTFEEARSVTTLNPSLVQNLAVIGTIEYGQLTIVTFRMLWARPVILRERLEDVKRMLLEAMMPADESGDELAEVRS